MEQDKLITVTVQMIVVLVIVLVNGAQPLQRCAQNCLTCTNYWSCNECKVGFYSGRLYDDDRYPIHNNCSHKCPEIHNCITCSSFKTCRICKDGYYNGKQYENSSNESPECRHQCFKNCKSCSSYYYCNECKTGFYNIPYVRDRQQYSNCAQQCVSPCKSCTSATKCTKCIEGYYFKASNKHCYKCNNNCRSCLSRDTCTSCIDEKYNGQYMDCRESCKPECKTCSEQHSCNECVPGRYGTSCEHNCSHGCLQGHCDKREGHCSCKTGFGGKKCNTCIKGRYGINCEKYCPAKCQQNYCHRNGTCYQCKTGFTGEKCTECDVGKYGINCNMGCPNSCANKTCTRNGTCVSCKPMKYGKYCRCSFGCDSDSCSLYGECSRCKQGFTGNKCDNCNDGKFGKHCHQNCPKTCLACTSSGSCTACVAKHWGNTCQSCPNNCLNCSSNNDCSSCEVGFYGSTCNEKCTDNCYGGRCNQLTGTCSVGCENGFYGDFCDLRCNQNCRKSICDRVYGQCTNGCKAGYNGTNCTQSLQMNADSRDNMEFIVGAAVGGGLLILGVVLIIVIVILVKRRHNRSKQNKNDTIEVRTGSENDGYNETNDTNLTTGNKSKDQKERNEISTYSIDEDTVSSDAIYAKPIKQKGKEEGVLSLNRSSKTETTNNTTSKETNTEDNQSSKHCRENNDKKSGATLATIPAMNKINSENDTELDIEENIEGLLSKTKSILEDEIRKVAELDSVETYYNVGDVLKRKIKIDQLSDFVSKKTDKDLSDEFQTLPPMLIKPYAESQKRENVSKNRYKGIYPYDDTRVVLKDGVSDYINASYIDGYNKNKAYIASIGPTTKYMGDMSAFWIMVWQENVEKIVMLTKLSECGVPKCDKYWPDKEFSLVFGNIQVTCINEEKYSDYTFRTFTVQKESVKRKIFQIHFTAWPDKGTPDDVTSLIEFRQKVVGTKTQLDGPLLVHCSAGIGRTGTYIALDGITKEGKAEGEVDIFAFVRNMREQRVNMIQTAEQYKYLHNALVHTLTFDSDAIEASKFSDFMKTHTEDHLRKMFEKLQVSTEQRSDNETEAVKRNKNLKDKNRECADIPGDRNRPRLYIARSSGSSDYINAVYVNSFQNVNRFLIAQTPLPETVEAFLTLILQEKVSCIISMETSSPNDKNVGVYYPADNKTLKKGAFTVKTECGNCTDQYLSRKLKISCSSKSGSEDVTVPYIQFAQWRKGSIIPEEPAKFVQFVKDMELNFCGIDKKRPVLVHCSTGAVRSGLFCVVSNLLEKTQIDQRVSVVNTVRQIKSRRHMAVPNKDQFIFCHQCVNEYLRTFDTYSNFELKT